MSLRNGLSAIYLVQNRFLSFEKKIHVRYDFRLANSAYVARPLAPKNGIKEIFDLPH